MGVAALASLMVMKKRGLFRLHALDTPRRDVNGAGALVWLAGGGAVYAAMFVGAGIGFGVIDNLGYEAGSLPALGVLNLAMYGLSIATAGLLLFALGRTATRAGLTIRPPDLARGGAIFLMVFPIIAIVSWAGTAFGVWYASRFQSVTPPEELGHETLRAMDAQHGLWWWVVAVAVTIGAPVAEEIIYRGFFQSALRKVGLPGWVSVISVSVLFTAVHVGSADVWTFPSLFVLSLSMGAAMEATGRLGVPIAMHACFNGVMVAISTLGT